MPGAGTFTVTKTSPCESSFRRESVSSRLLGSTTLQLTVLVADWPSRLAVVTLKLSAPRVEVAIGVPLDADPEHDAIPGPLPVGTSATSGLGATGALA